MRRRANSAFLMPRNRFEDLPAALPAIVALAGLPAKRFAKSLPFEGLRVPAAFTAAASHSSDR